MGQKQRVFSLFLLSPSSRRTWIEIRQGRARVSQSLVALLAEDVDRNFALVVSGVDTQVALLAEDVDRNPFPAPAGAQLPRRPPRGGRG